MEPTQASLYQYVKNIFWAGISSAKKTFQHWNQALQSINQTELLALILLITLTLISRLFWAFSDHPKPFSDMEDYYRCAINFLKGDHLAQGPSHLAYRPPLYPLFIAACIKLFPFNSLLYIRIIQSILSTISTVFVYFICRKILNPVQTDGANPLLNHPKLISFLAALTFANFGGQIFFTSLLMTETLFVFLLLLWIIIGFNCNNSNHYGRLISYSLLLGVLALIRPIALFFLPVLVFKTLQCIPQPKWPKKVWLPLIGWLLPIIPWTIRNFFVLNTFVLITTNSGVNFFLGHNPYYSYYDIGLKEQIRQELYKKYGQDEVLEDRFFFNQGFQYVLTNPQSLIPHSLWKLHFLYTLEKKPWPWEDYFREPQVYFMNGLYWPALWWNPFFFIMVLAGITYAFILKAKHGLCLSVICLYSFACLVFFARTRFRLPIEPFLVIYLWLGFTSLVDTGIWGYRKLRDKINPAPIARNKST